MQLRYVFSETGSGLRRNVSMTVALIVTLFVSLTLVGMGLLLNTQSHKAEDRFGSQLQITVYMCNHNSQVPTCDGSEVTQPQQAAIVQVLKSHPEVKSFDYRDKQSAYDALQKQAKSLDNSQSELYSTVSVDDMNQSSRVTLKDPRQYRGVEGAIKGMDGVDGVQDLHQVLQPIYTFLGGMKVGAIGIASFLLIAGVLQVANTIRLTALARRREIGIMRLVGAGSLYIQVPFLMQTLVAAVIGIALSAGALMLFVWVVVYGHLRPNSAVVEWIDWWDAARAIGWIAALGVVLTMVPTLVLTRKYLKV
jgi:cell division transport system permease protein